MIKEHRRAFKLMRMALDLSLVTAAYYAIYLALRLGVNPLGLNLDYHPDYHWRVPAFIAVCWTFSFVISGAYNQSTRAIPPFRAILIAAKMLGIMLAVFVMGLFAFKIQFLSRKFMGTYSLSCLGLLTLTKALEFKILGWLRSMGFNTLSVVLIGEGAELREVHDIFSRNPEWGYRVAGALGLERALPKSGSLRSLGKLSDLEEVLRTRIVDELVFAAPSGNSRHLKAVMEAAGLGGIPLRVILNAGFDPVITTVEPMGSKATLVTNPDRRDPYLKLIKRVVDLAGASLLLVLFSPLFLLIGLGVLLTMGLPVFFRQKRAGIKGRVFFLYKFRTMVSDARSAQQQLAGKNEMSGPVFKVKDDPRVTWLGRILRRSSLDELPQLFNVVKGELSLVGPRPLANYEARKVPHWARRRYSVLPGITCYWQVMGRNQIGFEDWMRLDLKYIDEWSLWTDFKILLRTLPAVFFSKGAY
jgi:exopolysaccharide biosynthesis polyprenyl glycosylphosphotransferase